MNQIHTLWKANNTTFAHNTYSQYLNNRQIPSSLIKTNLVLLHTSGAAT